MSYRRDKLRKARRGKTPEQIKKAQAAHETRYSLAAGVKPAQSGRENGLQPALSRLLAGAAKYFWKPARTAGAAPLGPASNGAN